MMRNVRFKTTLICLVGVAATLEMSFVVAWPASTARSSGRSSSAGHSGSSRTHGAHHTSHGVSSDTLSNSLRKGDEPWGSVIALFYVAVVGMVCYFLWDGRKIQKNDVATYQKLFRETLIDHLPLKEGNSILVIGPVSADIITKLLKCLPYGQISVVEFLISARQSPDLGNAFVYHAFPVVDLYETVADIDRESMFDGVVFLSALDLDLDTQEERRGLFERSIALLRPGGFMAIIEREDECDARWIDSPDVPSCMSFENSYELTSLSARYASLRLVKNSDNISSFPWRIVILRKCDLQGFIA